MIRYSSQTRIAAPPSVVFAMLLDPARYADWTDMVDMTFEGEPRVGARGSFRLPKGPLRGLLATEIVELQPDRRVVFRITHPAVTWIATSDVEPDGTGTRFTYAGELALHGWRRVLEPLFRAEVGRGEAKEAERFRDLVERELAAGSGQADLSPQASAT